MDGSAVLLKRWIVERTFGWLGAYRRQARDFEILAGAAGNVIRIAMLRATLAKCVWAFARLFFILRAAA